MNHTWEKQPDKEYVFAKTKHWICKVCGCEKFLGYYKFATPNYQRSGINFDGYVECYDEAAEMLKTID